MKLLLFFTLQVIVTCRSADWPATTSTPGGQNLKGKMFTLTRYGGGLVLYSPYGPPPGMSTAQSETQTRSTTEDPTRLTTEDPTRSTTEDPARSTNPYTTTRYTTTRYTTTKYTTTKYTTTKYTTTKRTTTTPYTTYPWTTASPTRGVSVCLRYVTDPQSVSIFTLSPYSNPMSLGADGLGSYRLSFNGYSSLYMPTRIFWSNIKQKIWTSVCVTVDSRKAVTQVFSDSMMSTRKLIPYGYSWSGEPTVDFSQFEGQVTDVQVWDYPLCSREVFYFLTSGFYGPYRGSVMSWSDIRYSVRGKTLMEDSYDQLMNLSDLRGERKRPLKWEKNHPNRLFNVERSKKHRRRWF